MSHFLKLKITNKINMDKPAIQTNQSSKVTNIQPVQAQKVNPSRKSTKGVEHQFLNKMPEVNSVENDLMKLLNEFSNTRLKKYGLLLKHFQY